MQRTVISSPLAPTSAVSHKGTLEARTTNPVMPWYFLAILSALMAFTSLSTDIYLPAMPTMARELQGNAELTITGFLIGFALAQLIWGPISDRIGRRKPLVIGMVLFVIGSAGCALSQSITEIVFWRMFQALGACTAPMLARTMVRDLYQRTQAAQTLSTLTIIMAIAPIAGPFIGGQIIRFSSWHSIFWLLAVAGVAMLLALRWLPETHAEERRTTTSVFSAVADYKALLSNKAFMRYTLSVTFLYMAVYAFIAGSPLVYIEYFHVDPSHYGWLFGVNIVGVMALSFVNRVLVSRYSLDHLLRVSTAVAAIAILIGVLLTTFHIGGVYGIALPVFVFFSTNGIVAASATAAALDGVPKVAGSAAALIGSLQYGSGIVSSLVLATLNSHTPATLVAVMAVFACAAAAMALGLGKSHPEAA